MGLAEPIPNLPRRRLEAEAALRICLHAMARAKGRSYPTLITTSRRLARDWRNDSSKGERRAAARLVREFLKIDPPPAANPDIREYAAGCLKRLNAENAPVLRAYVAVTEAMNATVTGSFPSSREWPCPWDRWALYIYEPLWAEEVDFVSVIGAVANMSVDAARKQLACDRLALVMDTVSMLARVASPDPLRSVERSGRGRADWLEAEAAAMRRSHPLDERNSRVAAALCWYVSTGEMMLQRHWRGYKLRPVPTDR